MTNKELVSQPSDTDQIDTPKAKSPVLLWVAVVILFICIFSGAGTGYWFFTQYYQPIAQKVDSQRNLSAEVTKLQDSQLALGADLKNSLLQQANIDTAIQKVQSAVTAQGKRQNAIDTDIAKLSGTRASDWLLAEADYLTRMAGRKLWLEEDTRTAILLLKEADLRLDETADPALLPIRKAIADDIVTIQQLKNTDTTSIALSLHGLIENIENLPLDTIKLPLPEEVELAEVSENVGDWKDNLVKVLDSIAEQFVRHVDLEKEVQPFLIPQQESLVREQLRLSLVQAQSSLLKRNAELFFASLEQAESIIKRNFKTNATVTLDTLNMLEQQKQKSIQMQLPQTLQSSQMLKDAAMNRLAKPVTEESGLSSEI